MYGDGRQPKTTAEGKPLPLLTALNEGFWDLARASTLSVQTCLECGHQHMPESPVCPRCLSDRQEWRKVSGEATLESWVEFHRAYWDGFAAELPYTVVLVRLREGPLFVSRFEGDPAAMRLGLPLRVAFRPLTDTITLPVFVADEAAS